ncbi:MAG: hypothetical protein ACOC9Z_07905 [Chloroflexota bacterium]
MSAQTSPTRVRIHSHMTKSRFLHVEDALGIGKIRLFAGTYARKRGLIQHSVHFVDIADARTVFAALARAQSDFNYREYKGTPLDGGGAVSRVLSVQVKGENVYVELKSGPGKLTPTRAVTPAGKATVEVNVGFKLYEAQRMAAAVLAYLRAWDVLQMLEYRDAVGQPGPYPVVPATSDGAENGRRTPVATAPPATVNAEQTPQRARPSVAGLGKPRLTVSPKPSADLVGGAQPNGRDKPPEKADAVVRARQTAEELFEPDDDQPSQPAPPPLQYGDGSPVDQNNGDEVQTFRKFLVEKQAAPASRAALQAYYRQRIAVH